MWGDEKRILGALEIAFECGQDDGAHHKMWVIDQMVRHLTGDHYTEVIRQYREGEDGPETFNWAEGIAP